METFLNRYRNITVLLLVIFAQLMLLAVQVKNDQDVRIIRVWAVTTVTPVARVVEWFRGGSIGFVRNYILMHDASEENKRLRDEVGRLRLQVNFLQNELSTAERAKALQVFEAHTQSKMLAANIIGTDAGSNSKVVLVNRGSAEGVMRGMAVVTPDGIVGKVISAYPTAAQVMLVTDPDFAAGVVSQKNEVRGTLKGQGKPLCKVDYVPLGEKIEPGQWFYTSGDDRVFPRGFAVGVVKSVQSAQPFQEIWVEPSGLQHGLEDVLIILEAVHQALPTTPPVNQPVYIAPAPPQQQNQPSQAAEGDAAAAGKQPPPGTEADKLRAIYQSVGEAQNHTYGSGPPGTKPPDFTHLPSNSSQAAQSAPAPTPANPAGGPASQPAGGRANTTAPAGATPASNGGRTNTAAHAGASPASNSGRPNTAVPAGAPPAPTGGREPAKTIPNRPKPAAEAPAGAVPEDASRLSRQAAGAAANPAASESAPGAAKPAGTTGRPPVPPAKQ
jgi:rod shape-determining protein MreC